MEAARIAKEKADEQNRIAAALDGLQPRKDDVSSFTWYFNFRPDYPSSSEYGDPVGALSLYMGKQGDSAPSMRLVMYYDNSGSWLFVKSYVFNIDGRTSEITPDYGDVSRTNGAEWIREVYDMSPTLAEKDIINAIVASKKAILRFRGEDYVYDHTVTAWEKTCLKNMITVFITPGGSW